MLNLRTLAPERPRRFRAEAPSPVAVAGGALSVLALVYIALIAIVMSYAALTVEFSQSVRTDEAAIAKLEADYLARVAAITAADYIAEGYAKPSVQVYVPSAGVTALRGR